MKNQPKTSLIDKNERLLAAKFFAMVGMYVDYDLIKDGNSLTESYNKFRKDLAESIGVNLDDHLEMYLNPSHAFFLDSSDVYQKSWNNIRSNFTEIKEVNEILEYQMSH